MIDLLLESINNPILLSILIYSYLQYILFFNEGKFKVVSNLEELFKIGFIFIGAFILLVPMIIYLPATINLLEGKSLPTIEYFEITGLLIIVIVLTFLPWIIKTSSKKFNIKRWFSMINTINLLFLIFLLGGIVLSCKSNSLGFLKLPFMAMAIVFFIVFVLEFFYIKTVLPAIFNLGEILRKGNINNKNKENLSNNMKKSFWKKLFEPEDSRLFGEILAILGGFLIIKWIDIMTPEFASKWLYLAFGFLFVWWGVKLIRRAEKDVKKQSNT